MYPNRLSYFARFNELGGCAQRDGGVATTPERQAYRATARADTRYAGPSPVDAAAMCALPLDWKQRNRIVMQTIHAEKGGNDLEALVHFFTDRRILDDRTVGGRVDAVLAPLENSTGARFALTFSDVGFYGDRGPRGVGFRDPHPSSRNQVGHFLTAVALSFDPTIMRQTVLSVALRRLLSAPVSMSDEDVVLRLIVGHELAPDARSKATIFFSARAQFRAATPAHVAAFLRADSALGRGPRLDLEAADEILHEIPIDIRQRGNSYQDLRLTLMGWRFGRLLRAGEFRSTAHMAEWIRTNLGPRK
jgi:hypothetical protein